jgi:hypothetical protein
VELPPRPSEKPVDVEVPELPPWAFETPKPKTVGGDAALATEAYRMTADTAVRAVKIFLIICSNSG